MKLSFSLAGAKSKAAAASVGAAPPLKKPAAFSALEDDTTDAVDSAPGVGNDRDVAANKRLLAQSTGTSKTQKKRMEAERKVDATVYEYDEVYDKMQEAKEIQKVVKEQESRERKVS
jgi:coiled-coil domain-containing protein 55